MTTHALSRFLSLAPGFFGLAVFLGMAAAILA